MKRFLKENLWPRRPTWKQFLVSMAVNAAISSLIKYQIWRKAAERQRAEYELQLAAAVQIWAERPDLPLEITLYGQRWRLVNNTDGPAAATRRPQ